MGSVILSNSVIMSIENPLALAIYAYMKASIYNDYTLRSDIMARFSIGSTKYKRAMGELVDKGIVAHKLYRNEDGTLNGQELVLSEVSDALG